MAGGGDRRNADLLSLVSEAIAGWDPRVERDLFGTAEPAAITAALNGWAQANMGSAIGRGIFYRASVGAAAGVERRDGRNVVIKTNRSVFAGERLQLSLPIKDRLSRAGFPAPAHLAGPAPVGHGVAYAESLLSAGEPGDTHHPALRAELARRLAEMVALATPALEDVATPPATPTLVRRRGPDRGLIRLGQRGGLPGGTVGGPHGGDLHRGLTVPERVQIPTWAEARAFLTEYEEARDKPFLG